MKANGCIGKVFSYFMAFIRRLGARMPMTKIQNTIETQNELRRSLGPLQSLAINISYVIGTGIFVLSGQVAANNAGPAVIISFVLAGIVVGLSAMSFSEMASMMPISGAAYLYTYATMGEYLAWIIGWNKILSSFVAAATAAVTWSGYVIYFFETVSTHNATRMIAQAPFAWNEASTNFYVTGGIINLPALSLIIALTILLVIGIVASVRILVVIAVIKIITILLFIFACCPYIKRDNFVPFIPPNKGSFKEFGLSGMFYGTSIVFFAYTGFDASTTTAQETINPQRSLPKGILGSFLVSMVLYVVVSIVMIGAAPYTKLGTRIPLIDAIQATPHGSWLKIIMTLGIIGGLPGVVLVGLLGPSRVFYSMAHDGIVPSVFAKVHPHTKTPWISTIIFGTICAVCAGVLPLDLLRELSSLSILLPYFIAHVNVIIMRSTHKDVPRGFRVPLSRWIFPPIGAVLCLLLMTASSKGSNIRLAVWVGIGQVIYFSYGFWHSKQRSSRKAASTTVSLDNLPRSSQSLSSESTTNQRNSDHSSLDINSLP